MPGADILWLEDGLICQVRSLWNVIPFLEQLGIPIAGRG